MPDRMRLEPRDRAAFAIGLLALLMVGTMLAGGALAAKLFAAGSALAPILLMALGAPTRRSRWLPWGLAFLAIHLVACALAIDWLTGRSEPLVLGMPPAMAVQVLGLFAAPFFLSVLLYMRSFDGGAADAAALTRLREIARAEDSSGPGEPSS